MATAQHEFETIEVTEGAGDRQGVVTVTLNRPQKKNAVNSVMWDELLDAFSSIGRRSDVRVVVVTGAGGEFCSGADLTGGGVSGEETHQLASMRHVGNVCLALARLPQPTIAKVRGVAVGAGCNMAFACDLVVAAETARFSQIFAKRSLSVDFGGTWLLPRRVGLHKAKELAFFADILSAAEADRMGLLNRVVPDGELDAFVDDWVARLLLAPPIAIAQTKRMLNNGLTATLEQALEDEGAAQTVNFSTRDVIEAMSAFVEKREPRFEGR